MLWLLFLIVIVFILWPSKEPPVKIQEFQFSNLCASTHETAPRIIPVREYMGTLRDIRKNKNDDIFLQCKSIFDPYLHKKYGAQVQKIRDKYNIQHQDGEDVIFRMASTPHRILAHFDCTPRYTMMLRGEKEFLLFKPGGDEVQFLKDVQHERMSGLVSVLETRGIPYKKFTLKEGQCFFLEPGMYHYIENNTKNDHTILVNIDYPDLQDPVLQNKWLSMWRGGVWIP